MLDLIKNVHVRAWMTKLTLFLLTTHCERLVQLISTDRSHFSYTEGFNGELSVTKIVRMKDVKEIAFFFSSGLLSFRKKRYLTVVFSRQCSR